MLSEGLGEIGQSERYGCCQSYSTVVGYAWRVLEDSARVQKQHRDYAAATVLLSPLRSARRKAHPRFFCYQAAPAPRPTLAARCRRAYTFVDRLPSRRGRGRWLGGYLARRGCPPPGSSTFQRLPQMVQASWWRRCLLLYQALQHHLQLLAPRLSAPPRQSRTHRPGRTGRD